MRLEYQQKQEARSGDGAYHHRADGPKTIRGGQSSAVGGGGAPDASKSIRGGTSKPVASQDLKKESTGIFSRLIGK